MSVHRRIVQFVLTTGLGASAAAEAMSPAIL
jgi:hypothetical protein